MCRCPPFLVFSDELEQLESLTAAPHASENMYEVEHGWFVQWITPEILRKLVEGLR